MINLSPNSSPNEVITKFVTKFITKFVTKDLGDLYGVSWSHGSRQPADVVDVDVPIGFVDGWLPFYQRGGGQVAEGTQV